jgi:N-acetylglucosaminyldiphosphoundecaprenol N-acetyl-beta-D-mannosaminyltransferase
VTSTEKILGYGVYNASCSALMENVYSSLAGKRVRKTLMCANPHSLVVADQDQAFRQALKGASWLVADGAGIVLASKMLGGAVPERITGSDVFRELNQLLHERHPGEFSCFFLGSSEEALAEISQKMKQDFPGVRVAGTYSPPYKKEFSAEDTEKMIQAVNSNKPDILWVGMTAPKQEKWIQQNLHLLDVKFAAAIGAVFDFYIGRVKRSPVFFQKIGLEWLPRLLQEPRRLFRRNFISSPLFLSWVVQERLGRYRKRF